MRSDWLERSQKNIIVITLSLIIAVSASIAYFNWQISEDQRQLIIQHKQNRVNILLASIQDRFSSNISIIQDMLDHSIDTNFSEKEKIMQELNGVPEAVEVGQRLKLRHLVENNPNFESVGLFLPNGDIYLAEPYQSQLNLPRQNYAFRDWYDGAMNNQAVYVSEPYQTHYTNEKTIALSASIRDEDGAISGIFHTTLQLDFLRKLLEAQTQEPQTSWYFVDESGKIGMSGNGFPEYDESFFSGLISELNGNEGHLQADFFEEEQIVVYKTLNLGTKDWFVFLIQPADQSFVPIIASQNLTQSLLVVSIAVIAGFGSIVFWQNTKNISIQKQLEKSNKKLSSLLDKSHEIEREKDEFSAMVTHELKTPLVPIIGYTKMLTKKGMIGKLNKDQVDAINVIGRNAKRLEKLISDIMDARKLEMNKIKFNMTEVSLSEFFSKLKSNYQNEMDEQGIKFVVNNDARDQTIKTDEDRLNQVFSNLIGNALKFLPDSGPRIEVGSALENDSVRFYVRDNGTGISGEKQKGLFRKFYQIDTSERRKVEGTGLGLVICKGIIEKLGGKIWVKSQVGKGTTFHFMHPSPQAS